MLFVLSSSGNVVKLQECAQYQCARVAFQGQICSHYRQKPGTFVLLTVQVDKYDLSKNIKNMNLLMVFEM